MQWINPCCCDSTPAAIQIAFVDYLHFSFIPMNTFEITLKNELRCDNNEAWSKNWKIV